MGDDDAFAVLVVATDADDVFCPEGFCEVDCTPNKNPLRQLVESVNHGFIGSICAPDYAPFFTGTVSHIVELCDSFVIPQ